MFRALRIPVMEIVRAPELLLRCPLKSELDIETMMPFGRHLQQGLEAHVTVSDNHQDSVLVNGQNNTVTSDLVWGTADIGRVINRNPRQVFHLISTGALKSVQKKGGRYVASRAALLKELAG